MKRVERWAEYFLVACHAWNPDKSSILNRLVPSLVYPLPPFNRIIESHNHQLNLQTVPCSKKMGFFLSSTMFNIFESLYIALGFPPLTLMPEHKYICLKIKGFCIVKFTLWCICTISKCAPLFFFWYILLFFLFKYFFWKCQKRSSRFFFFFFFKRLVQKQQVITEMDKWKRPQIILF